MARIRPVFVALLFGSCTYLTSDPTVLVTSTPAGAEVLVDGIATGDTTPSKIDLSAVGGDDHAITLRKRGFSEETRQVFHYTTGYTSRWIDGATALELPSFPLWWTFGDFFVPFGIKKRYVPHEIHVVLYEEGTAPVTGDAPRQQH